MGRSYFKKFLCSVMIFLFTFYLFPVASFAENIYTVKVPLDATVVVHGAIMTESNILMQEIKTGRIHSIAQGVTGVTFGYRYYEIHNLSSLEDITVYDRNMVPLTATSIDVEKGYIEYANVSSDLLNKYSERIKGAAVAYHNRTGGYATSTFYTYFQSNSDAAKKCEGSDSGRYWGQFVTARNIESVEILEVIPYGNEAFTSKVRIIADNGVNSSYIENYTINFLFQNNGTNFYVTNFTFMK